MRHFLCLILALSIFGCSAIRNFEQSGTISQSTNRINASSIEETNRCLLASKQDRPFVVYSPVPPEISLSGLNNSSLDNSDESTCINSDKIPLISYGVHVAAVTTIALSLDGKTIATGAVDGSLVLSTVHERPSSSVTSESRKWPLMKSRDVDIGDKTVQQLAFSPNGQYLAIAQNSVVSVLDLKSGYIIASLHQLTGRFSAMSWDPRGELLALGMSGGEVYIWNVLTEASGNVDSFEALEKYPGSSSEVFSLIFHPSGRAFFVAERKGTISLWRLLRTEWEMGLRDDAALVDEKPVARTRKVFAQLGQRLEDVRINSDGTSLFAVAGGDVYRWKIRGLKLTNIYSLGRHNSVSIVPISVLGDDEQEYEILLSSGRDHRVVAFCGMPKDNSSKDRRNRFDPLGNLLSVSLKQLATSVVLRSTLTNVHGNAHQEILWGVQKTGSLLGFNFHALIDAPEWRYCIKECGGVRSEM